MGVTVDLLLNAIASGILLGGLYAAVSVGVSISFGMLDIVNIAHPAFVILGSFVAYIANTSLGADPLLTGIVVAPVFYALGALVFQVYYISFERHGRDSLRGLAFFFGLMFITEVGLILVFGVDYRSVQTVYIGPSLNFGEIGIPLRLLVPCVASLVLLAAVQIFLRRSFTGRAILAVAQNQVALQFQGADPVRIRRIAFALSIATASVAGALLIIIQPIEPSIDRDYIGRVFAVCVLGGMGSIPGTLLAALILGIAESFTATFYGPSWAPAVSFTLLLLTLAIRPAGLLGR
jgi:branched-chain amino acid transport system permease protein